MKCTECSNSELVLYFCQLFWGDMEYDIFGFADVEGHLVTLEPDGHLS
jgi:hypothetical protein